MKRIIFAMLMILALLLSACAAPDASQPSISTPEAPADTPTSQEDTTTDTTEQKQAEETEPNPTSSPAPSPLADMSVASAGIVDGAMDLAYGAKGDQFANGDIPSRSFPLTISNIPEGTGALAISMIDPDGGNWVHWLAANIPADGATREITENAGIDWPDEIVQGKNDFGANGYGGPTPPSGIHTYVITVYALAEVLDLDPGFDLAALRQAMEGKVLAEAVITGTYAH